MEEKINAEKITFSQAAPYLNKSLNGDDEVLKQQCESGIAQCWRLQHGRAYMLSRAENSELVVCCFEGENLKNITDHIIKNAKASGFKSIRFHTKRPAIAKLINNKFKHVEHVFKRVL